MNTLAYDGPGPWILFFPLIWAAVIFGGITLLRRTGLRGHRGPWQHRPMHGGTHGGMHGGMYGGEQSPIAVLGRRFAAGEIDEDEYWRRLSVLDEQFGPYSKGGAA
ncbi:SHOCT domain-containing protein [Streptomyces sp. NBC_00259]|uniref:SHOCT domain-containing protein n=1 Tax=Streptomyces sp. NBC_00259 TaxID=2903643 RepID=UPI002E2E244C|nr:SHOCT domain-containing protein [Streptomyces sp. NBC_00259]